MKGIIFTEFLAMVETTFSEDLADTLIEECDLPSGGAYTSVGTYSHEEIGSLVVALSRHSKIEVPDLLKAFGKYLFGRFCVLYPNLFPEGIDGFQTLERVEDYIHVEVRKLYPHAELPSFESERPEPSVLRLTYRSDKHLDDLAEGLIEGCMEHFEELATIVREPIDPKDADAGTVFVISKEVV